MMKILLLLYGFAVTSKYFKRPVFGQNTCYNAYNQTLEKKSRLKIIISVSQSFALAREPNRYTNILHIYYIDIDRSARTSTDTNLSARRVYKQEMASL